MVFLILKKYIIPRCCNRNSDNLMTTKTSTVRYSTTELSEDKSIERLLSLCPDCWSPFYIPLLTYPL